MTERNLSDDELREALIDRGYEKVAAALDESARRRGKVRERLHAELVAEGYQAAAAALIDETTSGDHSEVETGADMNSLIRNAAGRGQTRTGLEGETQRSQTTPANRRKSPMVKSPWCGTDGWNASLAFRYDSLSRLRFVRKTSATIRAPMSPNRCP